MLQNKIIPSEMYNCEKYPTHFDKEMETGKFEKVAKINQKFSVKNHLTIHSA